MAPLLSSILRNLMQAVDAVKDVQAVAPPPIAPQLDGDQHTLSLIPSVHLAASQLPCAHCLCIHMSVI